MTKNKRDNNHFKFSIRQYLYRPKIEKNKKMPRF